MSRGWKYALAAIGAGALVGSVASTAFAGHVAATKRTTITGQLYITDVTHMNKNASVYGHLYAHNGAQVWKGLIVKQGGLTAVNGITVNTGGLTVQAGGVKSDSLAVSGPITATDASISGNLQSGTLQTGTINSTGALTAAGKITGNGIDAGSGGLTTTGNITTTGTISGNLALASGANLSTSGTVTAGTLTASTINTTGTLTAQNLTATGTATVGTLNSTNLAVTGNVNFTGAHVSGIDLSSVLGSGSVPALTVGNASAANPPLVITQGSNTAQVGVNSAGALTISSLSVGHDAAVTGNLTVGGSLTTTGALTLSGGLTIPSAATLTASTIQGTPSGNNPGALTINTSGLALNGSLNLSASSNLALNTATNAASHLLTNGDTDVAGTIPVVIPNTGTGEVNANFPFKAPYANPPIVVVSPTGDPNQNGAVGVRYWVTSTTSGFTVHVNMTTRPTTQSNLTFSYHVFGP